MATYVAVPLKRTWEVDLTQPLRQFISNTYDKSDPAEYNQAITEFNKLRNSIISKSVDKHESALEVFYRYYDQLLAIQTKFPIAENQVRINFKWQDAFDKESFFTGKRTLAIASAAYEKVCVLFNIAALQSQIADVQNHTTDEGLKLSAKLFQQACGIFNYLKDSIISHVQQDPTPDLQPDSLATLASLTLAQAQDCFCRKAINDKMKPAVIAKLCNQCSDYYAEALKLLQLDSLKYLWPKDWIASVAGKQASYHAISEYYQSLVAKEGREFGEEIARLKHAKELITAAETRGGEAFIFQDYQQRIARALEQAVKDNDFIYHARITERSSLASIGKASPAKAILLNSPISNNFKDLFEKVVPLAVHGALSVFENRKAAIVNGEIARLREATQLMNGVLSSMNLPAALEDISGSNKVPQSLLDKAAQIRSLGGIAAISSLMKELPESLQRNKELLDEADRLLNEEEKSDKQLRDQFKERWTRTTSEKLTEPLRQEATRYRMIIDNAVRADGIVKERFNRHKDSMELLSRSDAEIDNSLPSSSPASSLKGSKVVQDLRQLMEQVDGLKAEREVIDSELKSANCDMTPKFLRALAQDGAINESSLSEEELAKIYGPLREQVANSIHRQEAILANVQKSNTEFCNAKAQNQSAAQREEKMKDLAAAFDQFVELKGNLEEGNKFYSDLTQLLIKFQGKVGDFCFARKTEKEELMKDLQTSIAQQKSAPPPNAPSYQQPTANVPSDATANRKVPPARPPPPNPTSVSAAGQQPQAQSQPVAQYGQQQQQQPYQYGQQQPAPGTAPGYNSYSLPYPVYPPQGGYVMPQMPQGFNPYGQYAAPQPNQAQYPNQPYQGYGNRPPNSGGYPQQPYPGYPPPQQWR